MPHSSGVFFLEEFGVRWATAFTDFLSDGGEELLCPLKDGMAAGISWTAIAQQGFQNFGSRIKVALIFQQEGFSAHPFRGEGCLGRSKLDSLPAKFREAQCDLFWGCGCCGLMGFEEHAQQEGNQAADEDVVGPGDGGPPGWHEKAEIPLGWD